MSDINNEETIPTPIEPTEDSGLPSEKGEKQGSRWKLLTFAGIIGLFLIAVLSAAGGYRAGINLRKEAQSTQVAQEAATQYALGIQDMQNGQYSRAKQRFEYVIKLNPSFNGVTDSLAEVLLLMNATATPSPVPTATITPTPDTREIEEIEALFGQAEQLFVNEDWDGTIDTLLRVRKMDPNYRTIQIDGMLFIALRNRGIYKIIQLADLEGGIYDLTLAERFGPLDTEAQGYLTWTKLYITGASFWELDWAQAVNYFSQVAPQFPGLRDGSGWTAKERYRLALKGYGDSLMRAGKPCQAAEQYQLSLSIAYDAEVEQSLNEALNDCQGGGKKKKPGNSQSGQPTEQPPSELPDPGQQPTAYPSP